MPRTKKSEKKEKTEKIKKIKKAVKKTVVKKKIEKKIEKKVEEEKKEEKPKTEKYYQAVGRRKTAIARVRVWTKGEKTFSVNGKPLEVYFPLVELQQIIQSPFKIMNCLDKFKVSVLVKGGGYHAQSEAIRHGLARVLILFNSNFRKRLKKAGYLTRDSRAKERKKFGLKRARKAPQWQKR